MYGFDESLCIWYFPNELQQFLVYINVIVSRLNEQPMRKIDEGLGGLTARVSATSVW